MIENMTIVHGNRELNNFGFLLNMLVILIEGDLVVLKLKL